MRRVSAREKNNRITPSIHFICIKVVIFNAYFGNGLWARERARGFLLTQMAPHNRRTKWSEERESRRHTYQTELRDQHTMPQNQRGNCQIRETASQTNGVSEWVNVYGGNLSKLLYKLWIEFIWSAFFGSIQPTQLLCVAHKSITISYLYYINIVDSIHLEVNFLSHKTADRCAFE